MTDWLAYPPLWASVPGAVMTNEGRQRMTVRDTATSAEGFDELGEDFERELRNSW